MTMLFNLILAFTQGAKAVATLRLPPPGSKTVMVNVAAVVAWAAARFGFNLPPEVLDTVTVLALGVLNLILRAVTKTPLGKQGSPPEPALGEPVEGNGP